MYDLTLACF